MSKKPLLSEGTARRWAKYAGIQNESKALLEGMYKMEEDALEEEALEEEALEEEALEEEALEEGETLEEADVLAELEEMLAEQDEEPMDEPEEDEEGDEPEEMAADDMEDEEDEEEDELDVDAEEAEADEAAMMSQEDVEAALKAGLEAMASAVADALKIKIDVRSGDEGEDMEAEEEVMEMDHPTMEEGEHEMEEGHGMMPHGGMEEADMYEGIDRDELVERVMKRVAARLVKESKEG